MAWKDILRTNVRDVGRLAALLELTEQQQGRLYKCSQFPINIPLRLVDKMAKGTLDDPILRQFVPLVEEMDDVAGFGPDPLAEAVFRQSDKMLSKYKSRVLLFPTGACAMHCRYCFRRHFDYSGQDSTLSREIEFIAREPSIHEVIMSGGDPLSLSERPLNDLLKRIAVIPHVKIIRFHSRFAVGIPERLDEEFCRTLQQLPQRVIIVFHINHARELDDEHRRRFAMLQHAGVVLLNQSVLLLGVNDNVDTLADLCLKLVDYGVVPYYLHQLDRVAGAAHFEVPIEQGLQLHRQLLERLPGYAVPRYVQERAGEPCKTPLR